MPGPNKLERRAELLGGKIKARRELIRQAIAPPNQRPPFTEQMTKPEALSWWMANRDTEYGREVLQTMKPDAIMELDLALAQARQGQPFGGLEEV